MIYALDKIAPGTANDDTLLYGVEVKFHNMEVALNDHLETPHEGCMSSATAAASRTRCPTRPPAAYSSRGIFWRADKCICCEKRTIPVESSLFCFFG